MRRLLIDSFLFGHIIPSLCRSGSALSRDFDPSCFNCQWQIACRAHLQAELDGVFDVFQSFLFCVALANATWNRWTLNNPNAIFIRIYRDIESHKLVLTDISLNYIHQSVDAFVGFGRFLREILERRRDLLESLIDAVESSVHLLVAFCYLLFVHLSNC